MSSNKDTFDQSPLLASSLSSGSSTRAVIVGLVTQRQSESQTKEYLDELCFLADTLDIDVARRFVQRVDSANTGTYVGEGKLHEIASYVKDNDINAVIFDDELSPRQLRNIERIVGVRVMDRTIVILEIFERRAQTSYAKTQVEMAHLQYMLPRLSRMWSHLDRQRGGGATSRGMGETQIEADKRLIRNRISLLRSQLKDIDRQMSTQRQNRGKMVRVALVGYTNVGKSTLMNLLAKTEVFAENKLFATLDTTVRKVTIDNLPFLLSDTVGFIRKLPTTLIESFKSTLDEVREADLLLHVVDISHPNFEEQYNVVCETLRDIMHDDKPSIVVFNKIDDFTFVKKDDDDLTEAQACNRSLEELQTTWMSHLEDRCVFISAKKKENIERLKAMMYENIKAIHIERYPYNDFLFERYDVE
ncbi:MAG TPA: GTPase HflX [Bacteroidales bacterium]|nr:GTPase HflX [Bacteroidales bacterium]